MKKGNVRYSYTLEMVTEVHLQTSCWYKIFNWYAKAPIFWDFCSVYFYCVKIPIIFVIVTVFFKNVLDEIKTINNWNFFLKAFSTCYLKSLKVIWVNFIHFLPEYGRSLFYTVPHLDTIFLYYTISSLISNIYISWYG
jgi:hypothetical protein